MTLHYRKLLIASLLFPVVVIGAFALTMPALMESRSSAAFAQLRAETKSAEQLVELVASLNADAALEPPIEELRNAVQRQYDSLVDFRESILNDAERKQSGGWLPLITGAVAIIGTLSSVMLSWRQDMRQTQRELGRLPAEVLPDRSRDAA